MPFFSQIGNFCCLLGGFWVFGRDCGCDCGHYCVCLLWSYSCLRVLVSFRCFLCFSLVFWAFCYFSGFLVCFVVFCCFLLLLLCCCCCLHLYAVFIYCCYCCFLLWVVVVVFCCTFMYLPAYVCHYLFPCLLAPCLPDCL